MSKLSRTKGASGEREFASEFYQWSGIKLRRRLDQYQADGGFDLEPEPRQPEEAKALVSMLAIEVKRYATITDGLIKRWWLEAVREAEIETNNLGANSTINSMVPVLAYRADRGVWKVQIQGNGLKGLETLSGTITMSLQDFCALVREGAWL